MPPAELSPLQHRISDYPAWHARRHPDRLALAIAGGPSFTYGQLAREIDRLACALIASGVRKGDRVASLHPPHPLYVIDFLATASIGAIWVGLNPRYQLRELAHVIGDAEPSVLLARTRIGSRSYEDEIGALAAATPGLDRIVCVEEDGPFEPLGAFLDTGAEVDPAALDAARAAAGGRDPCLIVYTSGSTGAPKGALLHHDGLARFATGQNRLWPVRDYRGLNYFPINHVGSVADCTLPCLVAGGALHFMEQFDPAACLDLMVRERITIWGSVPSTFPMMLDLPNFPDADLSAVELIAWGGAAMPEPVILRLQPTCRRMATNYGMTETTSAITALAPTDDVERLAGSVGEAFPEVELRLTDADSPVADGAVGEIETRSPLLFAGYWRQPQATRDAFTQDGWFRTGDLARRRPDGSYAIVGRTKEMFKSGGYNVYPREIEAVLEAHPMIEAAAVVAVPDPVWQEVGIAFIVATGEVSDEDVLGWARDRLANYKIPKQFRVVPALPLLPIGKVDKKTLRSWASNRSGE